MRRFLNKMVWFSVFAVMMCFSAHAATIKAGGEIPIKAPKTETDPEAALSQDQKDTPEDHEDVLDSAKIFRLIESDKAFEIKRGFSEIQNHIDSYLKNKPAMNGILERAIDLLGHPSVNVREASTRFLENNMEKLVLHAFITADTFSKRIQKAFSHKQEHLRCLSLFNLILPHQNPDFSPILDPEHTYMVIDGLNVTDDTVLKQVENALVKQGKILVAKQLWKDRHTQIFLEKIRKIPLKNQMLFLQIIDANLSSWAGHELLEREDFIRMLSKMKLDDIAFQEKFIEFFTSSNNIPTLKKINLFDHEWANKLAQNIIQDVKPEENDFSLRLFSQLLPAFVQSGGINGVDFHKVWRHVAAHPGAYIDPLQIISNNFQLLTRNKWFTPAEISLLVQDFEKHDETTQNSFLKFFRENYKLLDQMNWIDPDSMSGMLFSASPTPELKLAKLDFIRGHPDLVQSKNIYDAPAIDALIDSILREPNSESVIQTDILALGFDTWARERLLDAKDVSRIFNIDISYGHSANLMDLAKANYVGFERLFDKKTIVTMAQMCLSPLPEVRDSTVDFFKTHYPLLKSKVNLFNGKLRQVFRKVGFWDEVSQRKGQ